MPFVADPTNVATPADSDQARNAAAEMRAIKQRITTENTAQNTAIGTAQTTANTAVSNAAAAQSTANTAVANAATAQGTANTALANAATAQSAANDALAAATALGFSSVQLTGSGLWDVPVGVTEVIAFMQGGGTASYDITLFYYRYITVRTLGEFKTVRIDTTLIPQLAYSVGVGQVMDGSPPAKLTYVHDFEITAATATSLAGYSAPAGRCLFGSGTESATPSTMLFQLSQTYTGNLPNFTTATGTRMAGLNANVAGDAGSLILLYR